MLLSSEDYLRLAIAALEEQIVPALPEGEHQVLASTIVAALDELRKRERVLPGLRAELAPTARELLARLAEVSNAPALRAKLGRVTAALKRPSVSEQDWQELIELLDAGARTLLDKKGEANSAWLRDAAEWELSWYRRFADAAAPPSATAARSVQKLTREKLEKCLAERLPDRPGLRVTDYREISGGFSNETFFFTLASEGRTREELVVRKNAPWPFFSHWAHDCAVESRILSVVADAGLPVPQPLWLFTDLPDVDGSFYVMTRGQGRMAGTLAGAHDKLPEKLLFSLAEFLADLHRIPAQRFASVLEGGALPTRPGDTIETAVRRNVESMRKVWENGPRFPSPGEAYAIDWLLENVPANDRAPSLVHTDCFVHNFLVENNEIETVVDWEASHLGDPAEDLAYVKDQVSQHMDWKRFLAHYRTSGGAEIDESNLNYYKCLLNFRNYFGSNIGAARIPQGYNDIRMVPLGSQFFTMFMQATIEAATASANGDDE